jgi:stage II sporulation protein R
MEKQFFKFIDSSNVKRYIFILFLLILYTFICAFSYVNAVSSDIANNVFRLHVIANSDSEEDQNLKYIVRDNVLEYMNEISKNATSKEEIIALITEHKEDFYNVAINTIREQGYNYDVNINIGNFEFPTKTYGDISLPAGFYDALRIEIGEASGKNWWCVMFPPLCFIDVTSGIVDEDSKDLLKENLTEEEYNIISDDSTEFKLKFKFIELLQNVNIFTAKLDD